MQKLAESTMQIFRVGSNEFLIIAADSDKNKLISLAKRIQTTILKTVEDKPKVIQLITFSIGIAGDRTMLGRILAVCDSFDAMISRRTYKEALSVEYAVGELERGKGTQFDPEVAQAFIEMVEEDPGFVVHQ